MTTTAIPIVSSSSTGTRRATRHHNDRSPRRGPARVRNQHSVREARRPLGRYTEKSGRERELIACQGASGSVLVIDRDALTLSDRRLVAHLGADEPPENAALVCDRYLEDTRRGRCRQLSAHDLTVDPYATQNEAEGLSASDLSCSELLDPRGREAYQLALAGTKSICELRWRAHPPGASAGASRPVSLREAVGAIESYEPACELTLAALALFGEDPGVSVAALRSEHARLRESPLVLNRGVREAVLSAIDERGLTMSKIALRCGRAKRDSKGNISGDASWLARRLGLVPESGGGQRTAWIHSDVLALIARRGLAVSPREVELG